MAVGGTRVVQVTNIAPQATKDQMQTLFGYLGKIEDIRLYPTIRDVSCPVQSRICYIKFIDSSTVGIAQHMTNTVFIDRALIVIPIQNGEIPDEYYALEMTKNGTIVPGLCPTEPKLPPNVVNSVSGIGTEQVIITTDPHLQANNLPLYPPLPANYDSVKIEEVRRTVLIHNIDSSITTEDLVNFFAKTGEIKYFRTCTRTSDNTNHMLVEFSEQPSILEALKLNGKEFKGKLLKITHATQAISKPQAKSNEIAQREIEEAMSQAKEAQSLISAAMDPVIGVDLDLAQDLDDLVQDTVLEDHHLILEGLDHEIEEDDHVPDIGQDLDPGGLDQEVLDHIDLDQNPDIPEGNTIDIDHGRDRARNLVKDDHEIETDLKKKRELDHEIRIVIDLEKGDHEIRKGLEKKIVTEKTRKENLKRKGVTEKAA
ncbi:RNA recognition motif [Popillia japonica]|uniref:RNA recognition motif n=1 Tax=Popillia japonica TaxID=7064 RepID=A0AAW1JBT1_POPJA